MSKAQRAENIFLKLRQGLKLTQFEMAGRIGMAQESLSRMETGHRKPNLATLIKMSRAYGVSLDFLAHPNGKLSPKTPQTKSVAKGKSNGKDRRTSRR